MVIGDDMVNAKNSYKIHFNRNMADDINYRTYETPGCKTFLLTNYTENLEKQFKIGEHIQTYTTKEDLLDKIKYYLEHESERKKIEDAGYQWTRTHHMYSHRCQRLVEIINENI